MLSAKRINELIDNNKDLLEALEEFDRTGQLSKPSYKERATFTIDMGLMKKFRNYCENHNQKMSNVIEELIKEMLGIK